MGDLAAVWMGMIVGPRHLARTHTQKISGPPNAQSAILLERDNLTLEKAPVAILKDGGSREGDLK